MLLLLLNWGCMSVDQAPCETEAPVPGALRVGIVECEEALPSGANGVVGDLMLANSEAYAIIRMDSEAKYFLHVGGGSLVDMGQWGRRESLAEAVPLVGGRWMRASDVDWGIDESGAWVRLEGIAEPIHFLDADPSGSGRITYRLGATGTSLEVEGADGLLFLGEEGGRLVDEAWEGDESRFSMEGVERDLGGAVRFAGDTLTLEAIAEDAPEDESPEAALWMPEFADAVRVVLDVDVYPSRRSRENPDDALARLSAEGVGLVVLTPVDEVGVPPEAGDADARVIGGSLAEAPGLGQVVVWPVNAKSHKPAHGAAPWEGLDAAGVLAAAKTEASGRRAMVDVAWAEAAGPMVDWSVQPDLIALNSLEEFHRVRALWQTGAGIGFTGPTTWVPADTTSLPSLAALERPLLSAQSSASSGPLLLVERHPSEWPHWDVLRLRTDALVDHSVEALSLWNVDGLLHEVSLSEQEDAIDSALLVPSQDEVWAMLTGADWAVSSVTVPQQSGVYESDRTVLRDSDAVFDRYAP